MTAIERCIKEAVGKGGYTPFVHITYNELHTKSGNHYAFLDPLFWQALGKAKEWRGEVNIGWEATHSSGVQDDAWTIDTWQWKMMSLSFHLASGKTAEEFFAELV